MFKPRLFKSKNGFEILVGKNAKENSYLTHSVANEDDLFFHVSDFPGSHVILRASNPANEDIQEAAQLAVHFSQAKKKIVKVDYTQVKNTSRPKGSPNGLVELKKFKSIRIERDENLITNLINKNGGS